MIYIAFHTDFRLSGCKNHGFHGICFFLDLHTACVDLVLTAFQFYQMLLQRFTQLSTLLSYTHNLSHTCHCIFQLLIHFTVPLIYINTLFHCLLLQPYMKPCSNFRHIACCNTTDSKHAMDRTACNQTFLTGKRYFLVCTDL